MPESISFTETDALNDLLNWSLNKPDWLRDALRRLVLNGELSDQDIDELEVICLREQRLTNALSETHVLPKQVKGKRVAITELRDLEGVNALVQDQSLTFSANGLTIVYGDNGSGKSGFVRVLKSACRSRDKKTAILRDVNENVEIPQSAHITFEVAGRSEDYNWEPDQDVPAELSAISVFDARSATTQVEESNNVAYVPFAMAVLEGLGQVCDELQRRVKARIQSVVEQTPSVINSPKLSRDSVAGRFVFELSAKSTTAELDLLSNLNDEELSRLSILDADLAQDPAKAAETLKIRAKRLRTNREKLEKLVAAVAEQNFDKMRRLEAAANETSKAATLASDELFAASPLTGVGSEVWRRLWEAARAYSDEVAYPQRVFPYTKEDARCVLCQQILGEDGQRRQDSFETFVKGETQKAATVAERDHKSFLQTLEAVKLPVDAIEEFAALLKTELNQPKLAADVRRCGITAAWRLRALVSGRGTSTSLVQVPTEDLEKLRRDIASRTKALSGDSDSKERLALVAELKELKDRQSLAMIADDVRADIKRKVEVAQLNEFEKTCGTGMKSAITRKNKELSEKLVTDALRGRFAREVEKLEISSMPIELRKMRDKSAQSYFKVTLVEKPNEPIGDILSEGEHRCVALAAFLAELVTSRDYSGIVFDDPMSSLDHKYRQRVAKRLVEEAQDRQVIVFTHDLTFLFDLQSESEETKAKIHYQNVHRNKSKPGYVRNDLPIDAKAAAPLVATLRSELKGVKGDLHQWSLTRRSLFIRGFIGELRIAWEHAIADLLRPVMSRFSTKVNVSSMHKLAIISQDDIRIVHEAQARLSSELHSSPETINPEETTHAELLNEIKCIETWIRDTQNRQKAA